MKLTSKIGRTGFVTLTTYVDEAFTRDGQTEGDVVRSNSKPVSKAMDMMRTRLNADLKAYTGDESATIGLSYPLPAPGVALEGI